MQRKAKECQSAHAGKRRDRLRLRGHSSAERFAARDQRQSDAALRSLRHRRADRCMRDRGRIGPLAASLHVGKLIAQRRDAAPGKASGNRFHRGMGHAGARTMSKNVTRLRLYRPQQQR